jgi:hypothetical protein
MLTAAVVVNVHVLAKTTGTATQRTFHEKAHVAQFVVQVLEIVKT